MIHVPKPYLTVGMKEDERFRFEKGCVHHFMSRGDSNVGELFQSYLIARTSIVETGNGGRTKKIGVFFPKYYDIDFIKDSVNYYLFSFSMSKKTEVQYITFSSVDELLESVHFLDTIDVYYNFFFDFYHLTMIEYNHYIQEIKKNMDGKMILLNRFYNPNGNLNIPSNDWVVMSFIENGKSCPKRGAAQTLFGKKVATLFLSKRDKINTISFCLYYPKHFSSS